MTGRNDEDARIEAVAMVLREHMHPGRVWYATAKVLDALDDCGSELLDGCCEQGCTSPDDPGLYADEHCVEHCSLTGGSTPQPDSATTPSAPSESP